MSVLDLDLGRTAELVMEQLDEPMVGSSLVRLVRTGDEPDDFELGIRPLEGHPADVLEGFRAPASWVVLGLASGGWLAPMEGIRPSQHPDAKRITQVVLIDRNGSIGCRVRLPDGSTMCEAPTVGAVLEVLRAALGLPRVA